MSKEHVIGFSVGFVLVLTPVFALGWIDDDWLRGARISISLESWASALGSAALVARATRRLLITQDRQQKGSADVL